MAKFYGQCVDPTRRGSGILKFDNDEQIISLPRTRMLIICANSLAASLLKHEFKTRMLQFSSMVVQSPFLRRLAACNFGTPFSFFNPSARFSRHVFAVCAAGRDGVDA